MLQVRLKVSKPRVFVKTNYVQKNLDKGSSMYYFSCNHRRDDRISRNKENIMYSTIRAGIACVMLLVPGTVWAAHPLGVEDTATEGKGNYLLEVTGDYARDKSMKSTTMTGIFTVGAGESIDFSVEAPYRKLDPSPVTGEFASGTGDVRIKMKQQLFENEVKQSMAYQIYMDLPTGDADKGLGTNNVLWGVTLIDSQGCCSNAYHVHLGYEVLGRDVKKRHFAENYAINFGLAAEHKLSESVRVMAELSGENRKETSRAADVSSYSQPLKFLAGVIYDISKTWYVDLGARVGLNKYAEDHRVLAATAWKF